MTPALGGSMMKDLIKAGGIKKKTALAFLMLTVGFPLPAAPDGGLIRGADRRAKLSPLLLEEVRTLTARPAYDYPIPVIIKVKPEAFAQHLRQAGGRGPAPANAMPLIAAFNARLTARQLQRLQESDEVEYVTLDPVIRAGGGKGIGKPGDATVVPALASIGAYQAHQMGVKGGGVTAAVFDSGLTTHHDLSVRSRVRASVDFTSGAMESNYYTDKFGHGTHVAGIIGGDGKKSRGLYAGVAPKAKFVDVKVVGEDGTGLTSNLIKAIDWVIANKDRYEIQVANLSVSHPPVESYRTDPLGEAVSRMVEAGIVTVASAGNLGRTKKFAKIWGGITSPGNHPAVIAVAPVNNSGTAAHDDDVATSYGSRGPTYLDGLFKPDLAAPGNQIVSLLARGSFFERQYPELEVSKEYIALSGASMATGYVSGTAALVLSANPGLTPRVVKLILMLTAVKLRQPHILEQGNGLVNALTAVQLARSLNMETKLPESAVTPYWDLDGERVWAGGAFAFGTRIVYSSLLRYDGAPQWGGGVRWSELLAWGDGAGWADGFLSGGSAVWSSQSGTDGLFWTDGEVGADGVTWTDGVFWTDGILWTDGTLWTDGVMWTDDILYHNYGGDQ